MKIRVRFILACSMLIATFFTALGSGKHKPSFVGATPSGILAISSDGQSVDFRGLVAELPQKYGDPSDPTRYTPPFNPQTHTLSNIDILRIIGTDDRFLITNTATFPWATVVKIEGTFGTNAYNCTGWILGASTAVTAGHCVYDFANKLWASGVIVTPALNSSDPNPKPFGSCTAIRGWITNLWYDSGDPGYDFGVLDLACRVGNQTGNPGYRPVTSSANGIYEFVTGYPGDKGGTTMWSCGGTIQDTQPHLLFYDNDMMPGQSGSPVWETPPNCNPCVIAINAHEYDPPTLNAGVRITQEVYDFLITRRDFLYSWEIYLPSIAKQM